MCPIVDVAPDYALNAKVDAFFQVESLDMAPAYAEFGKKVLRESGLQDESASTILELRSVLAEYREKESKKKNR